MYDFTLQAFKSLLNRFETKYIFQIVLDFMRNPISKTIVFRHDVDRSALGAWRMAFIEAELGIKGTYYFRIVPAAYNEKMIKAIAELGHEIGYHYEDVDLVVKSKELRVRSRSISIILSNC